MQDLGKFLVLTGILLAIFGLILWSGIGRGWFGRLPGDLSIETRNVRFYFPLATSLLISLILSLLFWLLRR